MPHPRPWRPVRWSGRVPPARRGQRRRRVAARRAGRGRYRDEPGRGSCGCPTRRRPGGCGRARWPPVHSGSGVADAGGAPEADDVEAQRRQVHVQLASSQIACGRGRSGRKGGLDPARDTQATHPRPSRQQSRSDEQPGVAGVGAARDRRDRDRVCREIPFRSPPPQAPLPSGRRGWHRDRAGPAGAVARPPKGAGR